MSTTTTKRGKSEKTLALINAARDILEDIQPCSVRAVCYQLFIRKLIPGMSKNETNKVSTKLTWARENDIIPWEWIVDESREAETVSSWKDPAQILRATIRDYRRDNWQDQPRRVEIWAEKGTIRGTLRDVLDDYGVTFRVMHGYTSATVINEVVERSNASRKPLIALYIGDYDPSGLHMSEVDLPGRVQRYGGEIEIRRVALLKGDTEGLPSFPASDKSEDTRYGWFVAQYGDDCWEVDAMSPNDMRERLTAEIEALMDMDAWEHAKTIETAEIESMRGFLAGYGSWKSKSGPASICPKGGAK